MKKLHKLFFAAGLMIVAACLMFTACTKEGKQGTAGVNGINGVNGTNGMNGQDGTAVCMVCHTVANFDKKIAEYHFSKHLEPAKCKPKNKFRLYSFFLFSHNICQAGLSNNIFRICQQILKQPQRWNLATQL